MRAPAGGTLEDRLRDGPLDAVDLEEQLRTCSGVSVGASSSMSDRTPTGQDGTTYTEFYVAGVPQ